MEAGVCAGAVADLGGVKYEINHIGDGMSYGATLGQWSRLIIICSFVFEAVE